MHNKVSIILHFLVERSSPKEAFAGKSPLQGLEKSKLNTPGFAIANPGLLLCKPHLRQGFG